MRSLTVSLVLVLAALMAANSASLAGAFTPYNQTVTNEIQPQAEKLLDRLAHEGRDMKLDGVSVFSGDDKFLPGKIALGLADIITNLPRADPRLPRYLADFRKLATLTIDDENDTWGIYYYLWALNALRQMGRLDDAVDPHTLEMLKAKLDWRSFVDLRDYSLIDLPNNYYCVAFGIARLRILMNWEDGAGADRLLARLLQHYRQYSALGFADETDGDGRFDRYSILLNGEITQRFLGTGLEPPPEVLGWLRKSADVMLLRLNTKGEGFEYGRSLGPYGDTAIVEVLTAAAQSGILSKQERDLAYAFVCRVAARYVDFWTNKSTGSVDMWDQGRRTDDYRGKFRILGENLSLAHQFLYTNAAWNALGYRDRLPRPDFEAVLDELPKRAVTWFVRGEYDRLLLTIRDGERVIGLPLVSGAHGQHMHNAYFPIPYANDLFASVPDGDAPQLISRITLSDGSLLEPLAYFRSAQVSEDGDKIILTYSEPEMDRIGKSDPAPDDRLSLTVRYELSPGRISRTEMFVPKANLSVKSIETEFATYSDWPSRHGATTEFATGAVRSFHADGYQDCSAQPTNGDRDYDTPTGPYRERIVCSSAAMTLSAPIALGWTITYR